MQTVLPGARPASLDQLEYFRRRGRRVGEAKRDQRVVDVALVSEELGPERSRSKVGTNRFERRDCTLVRSPRVIAAAFCFDDLPEAVERLPFLVDEPDARGAVERGVKLARRFRQPPHAPKRLALVQERLDFSSL